MWSSFDEAQKGRWGCFLTGLGRNEKVSSNYHRQRFLDHRDLYGRNARGTRRNTPARRMSKVAPVDRRLKLMGHKGSRMLFSFWGEAD